MNRVVQIRLTRVRFVSALVAALLVAGGAAAVAQTAVLSGSAITQVKILRFNSSGPAVDKEPRDFAGIPSQRITVPAGQQALVKLTLAADSECDGAQGGLCRLSFQSQRGSGPRSEIKFSIFDSTDTGSGITTSEAHAITATAGPLGAGTYTFFVQGAVDGNAQQFGLAGGEFIAERIRV